MKALWVPAAVLAGLLCAALWAGAAVGRQCDDWVARLDAAETQALRSDWQAAGSAMDALAASWQGRQQGLHTILEHNVLEQTDTLMERCRLLCREKDTAALRVAVSELRGQFTLLKEMQRFSIENVL